MVHDNFWHAKISPTYIEWWYIDALLNNCYYLAGSFGIWGNLNRPSSLVIRSDFRLTSPGKEVLDFSQRFDLSDFEASTTYCNVRLGNNFLKYIDGKYRLRLCNEKSDLFLDCFLSPTCIGFEHIHYFDNDKNRFFGWVVPVPHARFDGKLEQRGNTICLSGHGYHDHNWASVSLHDAIKGWIWGRLHGAEDTLVFAKVEGKSNTLFTSLAWIKHNEISSDQYKHLTFDQNKTDMLLHPKPLGWDLSVIDSSLKLHLSIERKNSLSIDSTNRGYTRLYSHGKGDILYKGLVHPINGTLFHEFKEMQ